MKVAGLSALRTGRLYPTGNISGTHFCYRLSWPQGHSAARRIMSIENFIDTVGNRIPNIPACSAVHQPTVPLCGVQNHNYRAYLVHVHVYRVSQDECEILRESVPYVKLYRYNPKHLYPKLKGYGDNGQKSLKLWQLLHTYWLPNTYWNWQEYVVSVMLISVLNIKVTCE